MSRRFLQTKFDILRYIQFCCCNTHLNCGIMTCINYDTSGDPIYGCDNFSIPDTTKINSNISLTPNIYEFNGNSWKS